MDNYPELARQRANNPPLVPPSLESLLLGDILGIERFREQGRWPFSMTAAGRARRGMPMLPALQNRDLLRSSNTAADLDSIINRGYR